LTVIIADYPQLKSICWNLPGLTELPGAWALAIYEARWRHVDQAAITTSEQALIDTLVLDFGAGVFLV